MSIVKFLGTPILKNICERLLLNFFIWRESIKVTPSIQRFYYCKHLLLIEILNINFIGYFCLNWLAISKSSFDFQTFFLFLSPTAAFRLQKVPSQLIHVDYLSIQKCKFKIICDFNLKLENVARQLYLNLNAIYLKSIQDICPSKQKFSFENWDIMLYSFA